MSKQKIYKVWIKVTPKYDATLVPEYILYIVRLSGNKIIEKKTSKNIDIISFLPQGDYDISSLYDGTQDVCLAIAWNKMI